MRFWLLGKISEVVVKRKDSRINRALLPLWSVRLLRMWTVSVSGLLVIVSLAPSTGLRKVTHFYLGPSHKLPYK